MLEYIGNLMILIGMGFVCIMLTLGLIAFLGWVIDFIGVILCGT